MQWTDAIQAQKSAYTAGVFRMGVQLCFSLLMQLYNSNFPHQKLLKNLEK